jgi:hypothetical protein
MLDALSVGGFFFISGNWQGTFDRGDKTVREVVTLQRGNHELQFGGQVVRVNQNVSNTFQQAGSFNFTNQLSNSNLLDFMLGQASSFSQSAGQYPIGIKRTVWHASARGLTRSGIQARPRT